MATTPDDDLVLERRNPADTQPQSGESAYQKVAKKNPARGIWRWITIIMCVIVIYNVVNAIGIRQPETRADLCSDLSEFGCDLAIGAATAINVTFAVGAGILGLIALIAWRTRDLYKEVVVPISPTLPGQPNNDPPPEQASEQTTEHVSTASVDLAGHLSLGDGLTYRRAGRWARLVGFVIDLILVVIGAEVIFRPQEGLNATLIPWAVGITYWSLCHAGPGRTIGKLISGTKVLAIDTGLTPSLGRAILRTFTLSLFAPLVAFPVLVRDSRQGWHDDSANTVVVATR